MITNNNKSGDLAKLIKMSTLATKTFSFVFVGRQACVVLGNQTLKGIGVQG